MNIQEINRRVKATDKARERIGFMGLRDAKKIAADESVGVHTTIQDRWAAYDRLLRERLLEQARVVWAAIYNPMAYVG